MSEDNVLGNVKEAFSGKRGKVLLVGGGLAVAAYVWYVRSHPAEEDPTAEDDGTNGPATGTGNGAASPQEDPTVGNQTGGDTGGKHRPANNGEWLSEGTDFLIGRGVPGGQAYDALTKALAGQPLTTQQVSWVSQVIANVGVPPEGMPPLNASPPPTGGQKPPTTTPPVKKPPVTSKPPGTKPPVKKPPVKKPPTKKPPAPSYTAVRVARFTSRNPPWNSTVSGIAAHYHTSTAAVWNDPKNRALRSRRKNNPRLIRPGDVIYVKK